MALDVERLVDSLMADPHGLIIGEVEREAPGDLFGTPGFAPLSITAVRLIASGPGPRFRAGHRCAVAPTDMAGQPVLDICTKTGVAASFAVFGRWTTRSAFHWATEAQ